MADAITSTAEMAENAYDGEDEPREVETDMVATHEAQGKGIEFHVSMRNHTMSDMEALIVEAAAKTLVGQYGTAKIAKQIETRCISLVAGKADEALSKVAVDIIDQPLTPSFGAKKPVTMREFLGLYGREYLETKVDRHTGEVGGDSWASTKISRIEWLVSKHTSETFRREIEKATNAAIAEIQGAITAQHGAFLEAEKARFREALAKTASG